MQLTDQDRYRRWIAVLGSFIVVMFQFGTFKALGVFVPELTEHFSLDAGTVGLMASIGGGSKFLLGPLWGALTQVFGCRCITIVGGVLAGLAMIFTQWSIYPSHLALSMGLLSIGMGLPSVAEVFIINDYFGEKMSIANGIAFAGGAVGMIIFPPIVEFLINVYGWKASFMILGAMCFNICVAGALMKPPISSYRSIPQNVGARSREHHNFNDFKDTFTSYLGFSVLAKEPILVTYLAAFCMWGLALAGWVIFLVSYTMTLGYSAQTASFLSSISGVGTLIGRLMTGPITDWGFMSGRTMFCILSAGGFATLVIYPFIESYWALTVTSFFAGLFVGTPTPVVIQMLKELIPNDNEAFSGAVGLQHFTFGIGLLSGGPLTGVLFDVTGSFYVPFLALASFELLAAFLSFVNPSVFSL